MGATPLHTPLPGAARGSNPFPVYPVMSLSDIADLLSATVPTPEAESVREAVQEYASAFSGRTRRPLVLAVRGDYGSGKTHLMLYACSVLREAIKAAWREAALPRMALVATAARDHTTRLWDAESGEPVGILAGHQHSVFCASFLPDGQALLTASADKTVRQWDLPSLQERTRLAGHQGPVYWVAVNSSGQRAVTASEDRTARVWDVAQGKVLHVLGAHESAVIAAAFSADGRHIATGSRDQTVRIWDADTGELLHTLAGHEDPVVSVAFSPDGRLLASASDDRTVRLWNATSGEAVRMLTGHARAVQSVEFSADGTRLATGSWDKTARLWEVETGHPLQRFEGHKGRVFRASFNEDGTRLVTASEDHDAWIWDCATGLPVMKLSGHTDALVCATFSPRPSRRPAPIRTGKQSECRILLAPASETSVEEWFSGTLWPGLLSLKPRELLRQLLTQVACEVAEEAPSTASLADEFRASANSLMAALREADRIDASEVERRFQATLHGLCSDADPGFLRALAALRWEHSAALAERWLGGDALTALELQQLDTTAHVDRTAHAAQVVCAFAAICAQLNQPFGLLIDELEHLVRHDRRQHSRRNITWLKRLLEMLSRRNAFVFAAGHWSAWDQQSDVLDRFNGRQPIALVRLTADDVGKIIEVRAPDWLPRFPGVAQQAVVDATSGNIRRVMTVLYDLYGTFAARDVSVSPQDVVRSAMRRLERGSGTGPLQAVESAAKAQNAQVEHHAAGPDREPVDLAIRLDGKLKLAVRVCHARDEAEVLETGERFSTSIRQWRKQEPEVHGLFIALGAVNGEHLRTLDAARTEVDVINGEEADADRALAEKVAKLLSTDPRLDTSHDSSVEQLLLDIRKRLLSQAEDQVRRAGVVFADGGGREDSIAAQVTTSAETLSKRQEDLRRRENIDRAMQAERQWDRAQLTLLLCSPAMVASLVAGTLLLFLTVGDNLNMLGVPERGYAQIKFLLFAAAVSLLAFAGVSAVRNLSAAAAYQRFRITVLEEADEHGMPLTDFLKTRRQLDRALQEAGVRQAARWFEDHRPGGRPAKSAPAMEAVP